MNMVGVGIEASLAIEVSLFAIAACNVLIYTDFPSLDMSHDACECKHETPPHPNSQKQCSKETRVSDTYSFKINAFSCIVFLWETLMLPTAEAIPAYFSVSTCIIVSSLYHHVSTIAVYYHPLPALQWGAPGPVCHEAFFVVSSFRSRALRHSFFEAIIPLV